MRRWTSGKMRRRRTRRDRFMSELTAEALAKFFHETYERLAPEYGYETREESAVSWENVPKQNKSLMIATSKEVLKMLHLA